jgi:hypothetical protein
MTRSSERKGSDRGSSTLSYIPRIVPLVIKMGLVYLRFKRKANRAARIYRKELIAGGVDKEHARLLTQDYLRSSRIYREFDFSSQATRLRKEGYGG